MQKHSPLNKELLQGNNKLPIKSELSKTIMTRTMLKHKTNRSGHGEDHKKYKRKRNLVDSMNRKAKRDFSIIWTLRQLIQTKFLESCQADFLQR